MKEKITQLRKAIDSIQDEAVKSEFAETLKSVEQFIQTAENDTSKNEDLQAQLIQLESEKAIAERDMMKYKSIQKKATDQMTEMESELEKVKQNYADYEQLKAENENLQVLKVEQDKGKREKYAQLLDKLSKRPNFENFSKDLVQPTEEKPIEELEMEAIETSLSKIEDWKNRGFIKLEETEKTETSPAEKTENTSTVKNIFDSVFGKLDEK